MRASSIAASLPRALAAALAVGVAALAAAAAARAEDAPRYTIRQAEPYTGTHIPRIQAESPLPPDATYRELTPQQQAQVRSQYEPMADGDEPPYPLYGTGTMLKPLVVAAQKVGRPGLLVLFVDVDAKGEPTKVEVVKTPSERIGKVAAVIAMSTKFKPAVCHGQPCAMGYPWRVKLGSDM